MCIRSNVLLLLVFLVPGCFITQVYSQTGPGGVGSTGGTSTLDYWIDANNEVTVNGLDEVTAILDLSGNGRTNTITNNPLLVEDLINTQSVLRFNGVDQSIDSDWDISEVIYPDLTVFAVYVPAVEYSGTIWGAYTAGGWEGRYITDNNFSTFTVNLVGPGYNPDPGAPGASNVAGLFPTNTPVLSTIVMVEDAVNGSDVRINGSLVSSYTSDHSGDIFGDFSVGSGSNVAFWFNGDVAEVIGFGEALNELEILMVENYLAAKYGLVLTANDLYTGDDSGYDFDVAGIGRINATTLQNEARGTGIVTIQNPSDLGDGEYLLFGNDGAALSLSEVDDAPENNARMTRVWRISETGDVGNVDIRWDLSGVGSYDASELRLLIDTDNDGFFEDETEISGAADLGSDIFEFSSVNGLANDLRFTLSRYDPALPIELVDFRIDWVDGNVLIRWSTASETNNDYFTVERSRDALTWEVIGHVPGAGTSHELLIYDYIDPSPTPGINYYRLKQTDYDGQFEYSEFVVLDAKKSLYQDIEIYPNPAYDHLNLTGIDGSETIEFLDLAGKKLTYKMKQASLPTGLRCSWSAGEIPSGIYIIYIQRSSSLEMRQVMIRAH
jgi:hypothetical protein